MADVAWADLIGKPFVWGGRGPDTYDCWGLLMEMNRRQGVSIPDFISISDKRRIAEMMAANMSDWQPCEQVPGASVAIRIGSSVMHVGFLVERNRMVHAWERTGGVTCERLDEWHRRIVGFYRYRKEQ